MIRTSSGETSLKTETETDATHVTKGRSQQLGSQRGVSTVGLHGKKAEPAFISNHVRRDKHVYTTMAISTLRTRGLAQCKYKFIWLLKYVSVPYNQNDKSNTYFDCNIRLGYTDNLPHFNSFYFQKGKTYA